MASCDKYIVQAINANCSGVAQVSGLEDIAVIINRDDIDFSTIDFSQQPMAPLAAIPFKSAKKGFMIKQVNDSFKGTKSEFVKARFRNNRKNSFAFVVIDEQGVPVGGTTGIASLTLTSGGTGYAVGDIVAINGGTSGNLALVKVTAITGGGIISTFSYVRAGSGYSTGSGIATTAQTGTGSGFVVTIATLTAASVPKSTSDLINALDNGRFVVVFQRRTKNAAGDIEFKIMGLYRGLKVVKSEIDYYNEDTQGCPEYLLEEENVPEGPIPFAASSRAATYAAFQALCDMY